MLKLKPQTDLSPKTIPEGLEALPMPVLLWEKKAQQLWANHEFVTIYGPVERHQFEKVPPIYELHSRPLHLDLFSTEGRHEGYVLKDLQEQRVPVEVKISAFGAREKEVYLVVIDDVGMKEELQKQLIETHLELKRNQNALIQSSKLASLGELSSGIAHELNQPLQAILGFSQELTHMEKLSPLGMEFLGDIHNAAQKMREIIKSLRTFARDAGDELTPTSVEHAVHEAEKLMHHSLLQKGIELEVKCPSSLPYIMANSIQLEQVIVNLLSNARDAIEQTGRKDGKIIIKLKATTKTVTLSIQDNGCGMDEELKNKIFDPFFTTKEVGKGTGLGLSISHGILKRFGTAIDVQTKIGEGSTFKLTFALNHTQKENKT